MTTIDKKARLIYDATVYAIDHSDESWVQQFALHVDEEAPIWQAITALIEGYVDGFSYDGIKEIERLWNILCQCLNVLPEFDYSDIDFVEDILDNWEQYRT